MGCPPLRVWSRGDPDYHSQEGFLEKVNFLRMAGAAWPAGLGRAERRSGMGREVGGEAVWRQVGASDTEWS